ncbi:hypothetical protein F2Q68_00010140 [Brassica cretica]|uniref:Spen paralogue and orthologue SPOC C-terminal domain-containing protein n=1 Tax=Brassica cretica TaxID=69181 RepID=A0A8S9KTV0_BRACR|nr:hypothetical protein F2Q68_00010140 [Brassica cretica]
MSSIDSESPSESDILEGPFVSDYNDAEAVIVRTSAKEKANTDLGTSPVKAESDELVSLMPHSDLKSVSIPGGERLWEGALQLSVSSVIFVIGILKSVEKTTTKEWPRLLEIKGRVRLDAFEKFVRELPNYLSRAVMVQKSPINLQETLDFEPSERDIGELSQPPSTEIRSVTPPPSHALGETDEQE